MIFSRFEFALKANGYLLNKVNAEPNWDAFVKEFKDQFSMSARTIPSFTYLTDKATRPNRQVVNKTNENGVDVLSVRWEESKMDNGAPDLKKAIDSIKLVRNNLFHGGKYGNDTWHDLERTLTLILHSVIVIMEIKNLNDNFKACFENYS